MPLHAYCINYVYIAHLHSPAALVGCNTSPHTIFVHTYNCNTNTTQHNTTHNVEADLHHYLYTCSAWQGLLWSAWNAPSLNCFYPCVDCFTDMLYQARLHSTQTGICCSVFTFFSWPLFIHIIYMDLSADAARDMHSLHATAHAFIRRQDCSAACMCAYLCAAGT